MPQSRSKKELQRRPPLSGDDLKVTSPDIETINRAVLGAHDSALSGNRLASRIQAETDSGKNIPARAPGSERSFTFKSSKGTRFSDKPKRKKGERRVD